MSLGYIIESGQMQTDPGKIRAMVEWFQPTSRKQLQRILGFAIFNQRFIKDFSTRLTTTSILYSWIQDTEDSLLISYGPYPATSCPLCSHYFPSWIIWGCQ